MTRSDSFFWGLTDMHTLEYCMTHMAFNPPPPSMYSSNMHVPPDVPVFPGSNVSLQNGMNGSLPNDGNQAQNYSRNDYSSNEQSAFTVQQATADFQRMKLNMDSTFSSTQQHPPPPIPTVVSPNVGYPSNFNSDGTTATASFLSAPMVSVLPPQPDAPVAPPVMNSAAIGSSPQMLQSSFPANFASYGPPSAGFALPTANHPSTPIMHPVNVIPEDRVSMSQQSEELMSSTTDGKFNPSLQPPPVFHGRGANMPLAAQSNYSASSIPPPPMSSQPSSMPPMCPPDFSSMQRLPMRQSTTLPPPPQSSGFSGVPTHAPFSPPSDSSKNAVPGAPPTGYSMNQYPPMPSAPMPGQNFSHGTTSPFPPTDGQTGAYLPGGLPPQPQMSASSQPKRLDPNLMPSAIQVFEDDRKTKAGLFQTGVDHAELPPLCTTEFYAEDQGNSNPKFIRSTMYSVPVSNDLLKNSALPLAFCVTPLAKLCAEENPLPVVNFGDLGPVRCHRCKAYMCPFMVFFDGGRRFRCPFCNTSTDVANEYFSHLDHASRRIDMMERPELHLGSYEFVATKEYCKDQLFPNPPAYVFVLDVSYNAIRNGLVNTFCQNIKLLLQNLPKEHGKDCMIEVAFITYDQTVHFYDLKNGSGPPKMMVVNDVQEMFVPMGKGLFVKPSLASQAIDQLMEQIWSLFGENRITEVILGPALQAGVEALKAHNRSGKIFLFHTTLPTFEAPGKLKNREDRRLLGTDKEKTILTSQSDFYAKLSEECRSVGCGVDLFLFPNSFIDVATIGEICRLTGSQMYKYPYFEADKDGNRFLADLKHAIERPVVFDAIMRLRTSTGLRPVEFYGNIAMNNRTDIEMATVDSDKCVTIEVKHDDKLEGGNTYFQVAVLFTSVSGERRLRIHNLALSVAMDYAAMYRSADVLTILNYLAKFAERYQMQKTPKEVRESLTSRVAQILATYRQYCSPNSSLGQLVLPELLKILPLLVNSLLKSDAFSGGELSLESSELTVDDRAWLMQLLPSMSPLDSVMYFYPRLTPLVKLELLNESPPAVRCSYENLLPDEAYLLDNGVLMFLWIGQNVPTQWIQDVFGVSTFAQINTDKNQLIEKDNPTSRSLRCWIEELQAGRQRRAKIFMIKQGEKLEPWMKNFLVEDRNDNCPSYVDYLCYIHKEIRSYIS
ncbi:Protein transport protein Sec24C [Trichinella pseudospiralis]|uniref:Protein transport protein Sec24C n=2 Tax=Trichinella pseudospiralis TaxID=6337 RepID=A0A0V1IRQ6_TRIPS|nr:Protein transport protein Sec24C [Trichinella pseudospiralis]